MAGRQSTYEGEGVLDSIENWMAQRNADVQRFGNKAAAAGRRAWNEATRTGRDLVAQQPSDVNALGARVLDRPIGPDPNSPANFAARRIGNVAGVARGAVHSAEGVGSTVGFAARMANPYDRILSGPDASAPAHLARAANGVVGYAVNGLQHPQAVVQDVRDALHGLHVAIDPNASPAADTASGEWDRNIAIGKNQGELGYNVGSAVFGGGMLAGANLSLIHI